MKISDCGYCCNHTVTLRSCQSWSTEHQSQTVIRCGFLQESKILLTIAADGITKLSHPGEIYYRGEDSAVSCQPVNLWLHQTSPLLLLNKIILPRSEPLFVCLRELPEIFFHPSNVWQKKSEALPTVWEWQTQTVPLSYGVNCLPSAWWIPSNRCSTYGDDLGENTEYLFRDVRCEVWGVWVEWCLGGTISYDSSTRITTTNLGNIRPTPCLSSPPRKYFESWNISVFEITRLSYPGI